MIHKEKGGKGLFADQASQEKGGKVWLAARPQYIDACAIQILYFNAGKRQEHALIAGLISGCG